MKMRRVFSVRFYCCLDLVERCRLIARPVSTGVSCRKEYVNKTSILKLKGDLFKTQQEKYEDTFGNLDSFETNFLRIKEDPEDVKDYNRDKAALGKKIPQYIKEVTEHLRKRDYKSALRVLEVDMYNDRKPPVAWIYTDMIMYNARLGNLEEAYRLYTNFKKFGGKPSGAMYTALFCACQTCRNRDLALKATIAIREYLINDKNLKPNNTHYRAMIVAFGKHGDLVTCFKIFDELMYKRDKFSSLDFQSMFNAFLNDRNAGLRHALLFWRKMLQYRIQPNEKIFNFLLDCVRYCSLGDVELLPDLIKEIDEQSSIFIRTKVKIETINNEKRRTVMKIPADGKAWFSSLKRSQQFDMQLEAVEKIPDIYEDLKDEKIAHSDYGSTLLQLEPQKDAVEDKSKVELQNKSENFIKESEESLVPVSDNKSHCKTPEKSFSLKQSELPNLIAFEPTLGCVINFKALTTPQHRFMLLGGVKGFLKVMLEFGVTPTAKTLTQFLFLIPEKKEAYEEILNLAKVLSIKLDTEFFNAFIKQRILMGEDFNSAQKYLKIMQEQKLQPDLLTFGTIAMSCVNLKYALELVRAVYSLGFRLNSQIVGALLNTAVFVGDLEYVKGILDIVKEYEVQVDGKFISKLSNFVEKHKHLKNVKDIENKLYTYSTS